MPTPLEVLLDPISLVILALYATLMILEFLFPARKLPGIKGWHLKALLVFVLYFYLASYLPLLWDEHLAAFQLFDLSEMNLYASVLIALLVHQLMVYVWHRSMHKSDILWRIFHQMHHSVERVDTFGAFYFSPLDMVGFTLVASLSSVVILGIDPQATTYFLYISTFLVIFTHTNIRTPRWLGYIIQRPESHSIHHGKGIHAYNYAEIALFDILFGTFKNPKDFCTETGFYEGASARVAEMLVFRDASVAHNDERCDTKVKVT